MGLSGSRYCKENLINPEFLSVITLTDSLVQRLPLDIENSSLLEREAREQNIDDFWKDRMECLENAYMDALGLSENAFNKLEKRILTMAPPIFKPKCPLVAEELELCFSTFSGDPLKCQHIVQKFLLCIDTIAQDEARRACLKAERERKKQKCSK